ncbi:MAG: SDR family NAD(P)-dependent oxidoreductase [Truepera sp.]|nr:SDR family NAD(P)-dependent oxidoreductase [Truepera sp.]
MSYRSLFDLTGRTALVIGSGSGIGAASAEGLAAFGAQVLCADIDLAGCEETAKRIRSQGGQAAARRVDLTDAADVEAVVEAVSPLDALVCTPAINVRKPLLEITATEFDRVVALNMRGSLFALQAAGKRMSERGRGSIILFSSIRAQVVESGQGVYAGTKAATLQMVRALAAELGPQGVRANAIAPGVVETPLTEQIRTRPEWYRAYAEKGALGRWAQPGEMVGAVVYLASDASSYVTGSLLIVDGGWLAVDGRYTPPL